MREKSAVYTVGLLALAAGLGLAGPGGVGLLRGMGTRSLGTGTAGLLLLGGVLFVVGLVLVGRGHTDEPLPFGNRCGESGPPDASDCTSCGHALV